VSERMWGFKSPLAHCNKLDFSDAAGSGQACGALLCYPLC
jgi:hypothetical protein